MQISHRKIIIYRREPPTNGRARPGMTIITIKALGVLITCRIYVSFIARARPAIKFYLLMRFAGLIEEKNKHDTFTNSNNSNNMNINVPPPFEPL